MLVTVDKVSSLWVNIGIGGERERALSFVIGISLCVGLAVIDRGRSAFALDSSTFLDYVETN